MTRRPEPEPATLADLQGALEQKRSKYGSKKATLPELPGRVFDSKHEAAVARWLLARQAAGEVRDLEFQVRYPIHVNGMLVCTYVADFRYREYVQTDPTSIDPTLNRLRHWSLPVVADAKGYRIDVYRIKCKLMRAVHRIEIVEL